MQWLWRDAEDERKDCVKLSDKSALALDLMMMIHRRISKEILFPFRGVNRR